MDSLRPILWLSLAFVLFLMWQTWDRQYNAPPPAAEVETTESAARGESRPAQPGDIPDLSRLEQARPDAPARDARQAVASDRLVRVVTDTLDLQIDTRGGTIVQSDLLQYPVSLDDDAPPVRLLDDRLRGYTAQSGLIADSSAGERGESAPTHHAVYTVDRDHFELGESDDELRVPMVWESDDGTVRVEKTFVFERDSHLFRVEHRVENRSDAPWIGRQYRQLRHGPTPDRASMLLYTFTGPAWYDGKYQKESFEKLTESPVESRFENGWASIIEHYFLSAWIPNEGDVSLFQAQEVSGGPGAGYLVRLMSADPLSIEPGAEDVFTTRMWIGPKIQSDLSAIARGLELTVDYGIFTFLSKPLFWLLDKIHAVVQNWGWAIIFLTILIKLAFYKLSATSYRSMARMRLVAPKMQALKERHKDDKKGMNEALMALYKKEKINPLGGCLPMLVQIPVFIALYWVLLESVEMRQAPWMLWIQDLSVRDPFFILPLLMGVSMFVQFKLNPPPMDPIQARIFQALPIVFTVFFAFFPAGLVLYWLVNNIFSISQQWYITRKITTGDDPDKSGGKKPGKTGKT